MKWHFGCGKRRFKGWVNTDHEVDLREELPYDDDSIDVAVGQHVIEHFHLESQAIPLLMEMRRVVRGELWLTTPDMSAICYAYVNGTLNSLLEAKLKRHPNYRLQAPISHFVNELFHQHGEHHNLFDFELLSWTLKRAFWENVELSNEDALRRAYPEIPSRHDSEVTLVVRAW